MAGYEFEQVDAQGLAVRISGRVKWFDAAKGYGFIVPDDPGQTDLKDVLLHVTCLRSSGRENAPEGSTITCEVVRRAKGWQGAGGGGGGPPGAAPPPPPAPARPAGGGGGGAGGGSRSAPWSAGRAVRPRPPA